MNVRDLFRACIEFVHKTELLSLCLSPKKLTFSWLLWCLVMTHQVKILMNLVQLAGYCPEGYCLALAVKMNK